MGITKTKVPRIAGMTPAIQRDRCPEMRTPNDGATTAIPQPADIRNGQTVAGLAAKECCLYRTTASARMVRLFVR
jgi:hypothetical protein